MWSAQETKYHINILDLLAVKLAIQTFTKYRGVKAIHLQVDNIVALTYLMKMGGTQNLKMVELAKEIWEYLLKWGITITVEYLPSELNVTADWESRNILDSSEWMLSHQIFQKVCQIRGFPEIDLFCISTITSDTNLRFMETRSSQSCNRCISTELVTQTPVCFSPILHDSKSSQQNTQGTSPQAHINNPSLDNTSLVSKDFEHVNQESYFVALEKGPFEKPQRGNSSPSSKQDSKTGGLDGFRARLQEEGISKAASNIISKSRRPNSNANYESSWRKWASWCSRRETDSFSSNINEILDYLTDLYKQGLQYRTINNHRSAISAFHEQIQGKPVGEHPRVCALLAGIFNSRPPQPKYCFIWNVQIVIEFIRKEWGRNQELSDKFLTYKLTMLLALTSASCTLSLQHLNIRFMVKTPSSFTFTFRKLHKAWMKGKSPPSVVFSFFQRRQQFMCCRSFKRIY